MRLICVLCSFVCLAGCAAPMAAWKGRAYAERNIEAGELITLSSTYRNARTGENPLRSGQKIVCFEPHSEVAALMAGTTSLTYVPATVSDTATATLMKGADPDKLVQLAKLHQAVACQAWLDGVMTNEEYKTRVLSLLTKIEEALSAKEETATTQEAGKKPAK